MRLVRFAHQVPMRDDVTERAERALREAFALRTKRLLIHVSALADGAMCRALIECCREVRRQDRRAPETAAQGAVCSPAILGIAEYAPGFDARGARQVRQAACRVPSRRSRCLVGGSTR